MLPIPLSVLKFISASAACRFSLDAIVMEKGHRKANSTYSGVTPLPSTPEMLGSQLS